YFDEGRCVIQCSAGKYIFDRQCHLCHHTCKTCSDGGPDNCTACDKDKFGVERYFFQGECLEACPDGHFLSQEGTCEACGKNCKMCTGLDRCIRCDPSHYPLEGVCTKMELREAAIDEVEDPNDEDYVPLTPSRQSEIFPRHEKEALSCTITILEGRFPLRSIIPTLNHFRFGFRCYKNCPEKTYSDEDSMTCNKCDDNCVNCDDSGCYWCEDDFFLSDDRCVQKCEEGFYGDKESQTCEPCHRDCKTCEGPDFDDCDSCEEDAQLRGGECVVAQKSCAENAFLNGWFLTLQQRCRKTCPEGSFANRTRGHCEDCLPGCALCHDGTLCLRCKTDTENPLFLQDGQCVTRCERGYAEEGTCRSCAPECASCEGPATHCNSCLEPFLLHKNECRDICPPAYFPQEGQCHRCSKACSQCIEGGLCKECRKNFFLHEDSCAADCPVGFYPEVDQRECLQCHKLCDSCDGPDEDDCITCNNTSAVHYNGECLSECPGNTFHDLDTMECRDCDKSCLTCSGPKDDNCRSCWPSMKMNGQGRCIFFAECPLPSYMDQDGGCKACHPWCHRCIGPTQHHCLSCNGNLFLLSECHPGLLIPDQTCVERCPDGFYSEEEQRLCERCHITCSSCEDSVKCLTCQPHLFRLGKACVESCAPKSQLTLSTNVLPLAYQPLEDIFEINLSSVPISTHTQVFVTLRLQQPRSVLLHHCSFSSRSSLKRTDCTTKLPFICLYYMYFDHGPSPYSHYNNVSSMVCGRCDPTCDECYGPANTQCRSCRKDYFFMKSNGRCYHSCPDNFYKDARKRTCERCHPTCKTCKDRSALECESCYMGYVLSGGICKSLCVPGQYAASVSPSLHCEPCDESCVDCKGPGPYNCTVCPALERLAPDGRCLTCCREADDSSPMPWECCNCTDSSDECVLSVNFEVQEVEESAGRPALFIVTSILLLLGIGVAVFLFLHARSKETPKSKPGGYEKLSNSGGGGYGKPMTSYESSRSEQLVDFSDRAEEGDEDEDEDIVYMGQDGTVYRKFKYGLLEDDEEDELEYDDESYSFR
ncbi:hypothetical protein Z043_103678, partial [Scleropages formosus]